MIEPIPHPSGDVPYTNDWLVAADYYSPPKWGCSGDSMTNFSHSSLFPTQVGMFRVTLSTGKVIKPIPHPSGDVPTKE